MTARASTGHDAFDVGDDEDAINSINADGVAPGAIQGLAERLEKKDARIAELEADNEELRDGLHEVTDRLASLEAGRASPASADD